MTKNRVESDYFEWMYEMLCGDKYPSETSYRKLLGYLHSVEFTYTIWKDENRAIDGENLRRQFAHQYEEVRDADRYITGPCSVLEMMIALAIRCESIMDDSEIGDRTAEWVWRMILNLGLGYMRDDRYDPDKVRDIVIRFLEREYEPDGRGGLFRIRDCEDDLRNVEIWVQLMWYLDCIT